MNITQTDLLEILDRSGPDPREEARARDIRYARVLLAVAALAIWTHIIATWLAR